MRSVLPRNFCTSAHIGGQVLTLEGQTCSLRRAFTTNCSSRGKKAHPTLGAGAIRSGQLDRFSSLRLDEAGVFPAYSERFATGRTPWTLRLRLLLPSLALPHLHQVLDQLRPQLVDPFIHCRFDLLPRRLRML